MSSNPEHHEPHWLSEREEATWRAYRRMRALLDLQLARDLATDSSLSDADYDVLSTLSEADAHRWRLKELANRMLWSQSRLSHQIRRMENRGLVAREDDLQDGRGTIVALTDAGFTLLRDAAPDHVASVRRHLIDLLTEEEIEMLGRIARRVVDHLSSHQTDDLSA